MTQGLHETAPRWLGTVVIDWQRALSELRPTLIKAGTFIPRFLLAA
jgi:hypothetical protein